MLTKRVKLINIYEATIKSEKEKQRAKGNIIGWCGIEVRELEMYTGFMKDGGLSELDKGQLATADANKVMNM